MQKEGRLPPILFLQADNCGRENKNKTIVRFLGHLVQENIIQEAHLIFLPVGHTHAEIDQRFSVLSRSLKAVDSLTLADLMSKTEQTFKRSDKWVEQVFVEDAINFDSIYDGQGYKFKGLGTAREADQRKRRLHCLRVRLYKGNPVVEFKEFDCRGEEWRGDWQSGEPLRIFKTTVDWPDNFPALPKREIEDLPDIKIKIDQLEKFLEVRFSFLDFYSFP